MSTNIRSINSLLETSGTIRDSVESRWKYGDDAYKYTRLQYVMEWYEKSLIDKISILIRQEELDDYKNEETP